jgi:hypothetical protein
MRTMYMWTMEREFQFDIFLDSLSLPSLDENRPPVFSYNNSVLWSALRRYAHRDSCSLFIVQVVLLKLYHMAVRISIFRLPRPRDPACLDTSQGWTGSSTIAQQHAPCPPALRPDQSRVGAGYSRQSEGRGSQPVCQTGSCRAGWPAGGAPAQRADPVGSV